MGEFLDQKQWLYLQEKNAYGIDGLRFHCAHYNTADWDFTVPITIPLIEVSLCPLQYLFAFLHMQQIEN
jgi:hypothetical protein